MDSLVDLSWYYPSKILIKVIALLEFSKNEEEVQGGQPNEFLYLILGAKKGNYFSQQDLWIYMVQLDFIY